MRFGLRTLSLILLTTNFLSIDIRAQSAVVGNSPNGTVFIGDSITAFGDANSSPGESYGYGWTAQAVFMSNGRIQQLYNAGVPGQPTSQIAARFASDVISYNPGTVVIMAGTNDATTGGFNASALASTVANLKSMIDQSKQAGIQPILCTIPPRTDASNYNQNVQMINAAIHKVAQQERITLVDFYSMLVDPTTGKYKPGYDHGDGIHPSASACKAMAQFFITATTNNFGPSQESIIATTGDATNLLSNPLFLYPISSWTSNGYGSSPTPTYTVVSDPSISGNWLSMIFPHANASGQFYVASGPTVNVTQGHRLALSFKFQISGLEANGGSINMGYQYGASNFTYGYLSDTAGTFNIEFVAPANTFLPSFAVYPTVNSGSIQLKIAQMSLVDISALGF